jgi:hypothetical protein
MRRAGTRKLDLVGVAEIADRLGTSRFTVHHWRQHHSEFPRPLAELKAGPVWAWPEVELWAHQPRRTGRPADSEIVATLPWSGYHGTLLLQVAVAARDRGHAEEAIALVRGAIEGGAWTEAEIWAGVVTAAEGHWQVRLSPDLATISLEADRPRASASRLDKLAKLEAARSQPGVEQGPGRGVAGSSRPSSRRS